MDNRVAFGRDAKRYLQIGGWQEEGGEEEGKEEEEEVVEEEALGDDGEEWEEAAGWNACTVAVVEGIKGSLQRGPVTGAAMTNVRVTVEDIETESGYSDQEAGTLRAAAAYAVGKIVREVNEGGGVEVIEPVMAVNVSVNGDAIGAVVSDFSTRGGQIEEVASLGDGDKQGLVGRVPLKKILGYSTKLRSLTAGSGVFTAEYFAHQRVQE
ncbi:hypothetical protein TrRE_jg10040 [Triparma retinervis]|uniref:Elongation factor EFG domain-containing protein n=1 Tax=Triparma retinervis TaxID=2557542 RepID=A0A9W7G4P8_9STRA|nr:hypothetical protein TrRE_jg10040 [Triparma retinervis]